MIGTPQEGYDEQRGEIEMLKHRLKKAEKERDSWKKLSLMDNALVSKLALAEQRAEDLWEALRPFMLFASAAKKMVPDWRHEMLTPIVKYEVQALTVSAFMSALEAYKEYEARKKTIPKFKDEKEEAEFWATHSPEDFPHDFEQVKEDVVLDPALKKKIEDRAKKE